MHHTLADLAAHLAIPLPLLATSCRTLPLLPAITRNVKLPIPATCLEFGTRARDASNAPSKSGKNGNVDRASQLCRTLFDRWRRWSAREVPPTRDGGSRGRGPQRRGCTASPRALVAFWHSLDMTASRCYRATVSSRTR